MWEPGLAPSSIAGLIEAGRVHRRLYTDPQIFELEMERLFGRAWLFVGHESQVRQPGDFITTELGKHPLIMTRHTDMSVHVLLNRCMHRGPKVVNERCGHRTRLTCLYHGWTYDTDGKLLRVPVPEGCSAAFDTGSFGLTRVPRIGVYRGFVFASMASARTELRRAHRTDQGEHRRSGRSRARWRDRVRRRHPPLSVSRQLEAADRERARLLSRPVQPRLHGEPRRHAVRAA